MEVPCPLPQEANTYSLLPWLTPQPQQPHWAVLGSEEFVTTQTSSSLRLRWGQITLGVPNTTQLESAHPLPHLLPFFPPQGSPAKLAFRQFLKTCHPRAFAHAVFIPKTSLPPYSLQIQLNYLLIRGIFQPLASLALHVPLCFTFSWDVFLPEILYSLVFFPAVWLPWGFSGVQ